MTRPLNFSLLSSWALHSLIEALHDDVEEGVPHAKQVLEACKHELKERDLPGFQASPSVLRQSPSGWDLVPFQWCDLRPYLGSSSYKAAGLGSRGDRP